MLATAAVASSFSGAAAVTGYGLMNQTHNQVVTSLCTNNTNSSLDVICPAGFVSKTNTTGALATGTPFRSIIMRAWVPLSAVAARLP
jgi:hypothetical protein